MTLCIKKNAHTHSFIYTNANVYTKYTKVYPISNMTQLYIYLRSVRERRTLKQFIGIWVDFDKHDIDSTLPDIKVG